MNQSYTQAVNLSLQEAKELKTLKDGWTVLRKGKHVTLTSHPYKEYQAPLLKIEGTIAANVQSVHKYFFEDTTAIAKIRELQCAGIDTLEAFDQDTVVRVFKMKSFQDFPAKEALHIKHREHLSPSEVLIVSTNLEDHPKLPKKDNVDRINTILNVYFLTQVDAKNTHIELYSLSEMKIVLPPEFLEKMIETYVDNYDQDVEQILKK